MSLCDICGFPPPSPANLLGEYNHGKITLSWQDKSKNEGYFLLYRYLQTQPHGMIILRKVDYTGIH